MQKFSWNCLFGGLQNNLNYCFMCFLKIFGNPERDVDFQQEQFKHRFPLPNSVNSYRWDTCCSQDLLIRMILAESRLFIFL